MLSPKFLLSVGSMMFGVLGVSYILFPTMNAHLVFGDKLLHSAEPYSHILMQALGGVCMILASTMYAAREAVHQNMCYSIGSGFLLGMCIKLFQMVTGVSGGLTRKGLAFEQSLPAVAWMTMNGIMGILFMISSAHADARQKPKFGSPLLARRTLETHEERKTGTTTEGRVH